MCICVLCACIASFVQLRDVGVGRARFRLGQGAFGHSKSALQRASAPIQILSSTQVIENTHLFFFLKIVVNEIFKIFDATATDSTRGAISTT